MASPELSGPLSDIVFNILDSIDPKLQFNLSSFRKRPIIPHIFIYLLFKY